MRNQIEVIRNAYCPVKKYLVTWLLSTHSNSDCDSIQCIIIILFYLGPIFSTVCSATKDKTCGVLGTRRSVIVKGIHHQCRYCAAPCKCKFRGGKVSNMKKDVKLIICLSLLLTLTLINNPIL